MFGLGVLNIAAPEAEQLLMAIRIGIVCGLIGGAFNRGLVWPDASCPAGAVTSSQNRAMPRSRTECLALLSWGTPTSDGEAGASTD